MRWLLLAVALCGLAATGEARTLTVGEGKEYRTPSAAIQAAHDGDTIEVYPGRYVDCAVVRQNDLTIRGIGAGAVMTDRACSGKAILVTTGNNITLRNITLQRARVPDRNGAGIRAEGGKLTVIDSRFRDNENGILAANRPNAEIRIVGSEFVGNGQCTPICAHGIYVTHIRLLHVERSKFWDTHQGHHIKSRAMRTEVVDCDLRDGEDGNSSYLIDVPNGGSVLIQGNTMQKGPRTENAGTAIAIGEEGVTQPTPELTIRNNVFVNDQQRQTTFVRNRTGTPAQLIGNTLQGQVRPLEGEGSVK